LIIGSATPWLSGRVWAGSGDRRILVDQTGRPVDLPVDPQRVVALAPSVVEIIYSLKCENRLKGVTAYSDFPDEARLLPRIGTYINPDIEKIVSLNPDLCIAVKEGNPKEAVLRLESLKIPVYAVDPKSLEGIIASVSEIGRLLNATETASLAVKQMWSRIEGVKKRIELSTWKPRVFFQIGISPIVSAGSDTFINELIQAAGAINLAGGYPSYPRFSVEEVLALSPDIILVTTMGQENSFKDKDPKSQWGQWPQIPAVENNRVFEVDSNMFDRPTPRLIDGLELLARIIHPELF
jgi:iron complex transport system substrate-binding protein